MKALVGAFNQEKALVGAFSVIVQPVVKPIDCFTALHTTLDQAASWPPPPLTWQSWAELTPVSTMMTESSLTAQYSCRNWPQS